MRAADGIAKAADLFCGQNIGQTLIIQSRSSKRAYAERKIIMFKKLTANTIEFIPLDEHAKLFPPKPAKMNLPDWYKNLAVAMDNQELTAISLLQNGLPKTIFSIKKCIPVLDYMTTGYTLFNTSEILFSNTKDENEINSYFWVTPSNEDNIVGNHPHEQCPVSFNNHKYNYVKIFSKWLIKTPKGYSCLIMQPFYGLEDKITFFPAIVDTDTYDRPIGLIGYLNKDLQHIKFHVGMPLVNIFPFKRENWNLHISDVKNNHEKSHFTMRRKNYFSDVYRKFFWSKKRFD